MIYYNSFIRLLSEDPNDERWKGRKFEWFFTEKEEDIKLSSLPRPSFLPPEFWEAPQGVIHGRLKAQRPSTRRASSSRSSRPAPCQGP